MNCETEMVLKNANLILLKLSSSNQTKMNVTAYSTDSQVPQIEKHRHFL